MSTGPTTATGLPVWAGLRPGTTRPAEYDVTDISSRGLRETIRVLLVGASAAEEERLSEIAMRLDAPRFEWARVETMESALAGFASRPPDVLLLALSENQDGRESIQELVHRHPSIAVVTIAPAAAEGLGINSIHSGAQDWITSGRTDADRLRHVIRAAFERNRLWRALRETALVDELTGLYNRRGFLALARQQLQLAQRAGLDARLLFVDIDNMKSINDTLGHRSGDAAIMETADHLRNSFRDADLIGRIGGDEFVVLALEAADSPVRPLVARFRERLMQRNSLDHPYALELSIGESRFTPDQPCPVEALLALADAAMYRQKKAVRTAEPAPDNIELLSRLA